MSAHRKNRTCDICGAKHCAAGLCRMHYMRRWRNGSTDATRRAPGDGTITKYGYITHGSEKKFEHVTVAERALGRPLPPGAEVHHVDENRANNAGTNLVICPSRAYHFLLHQRMRALAACGNANYRKCPFCKRYSDPSTMAHNKSSRHFFHRACKAHYRREYDAAQSRSATQ